MLPLIIIIGPTGIGKTALGLAVAQRLGGEIISGDSIQVYRKLDIGSAKPTREELDLVPHHLIDFLDPSEPFTAAQFQSLASIAIKEIRSRGHVPIVVGGTGLYIRSLLDPYEFSKQGSEEIRMKWSRFAQSKGSALLHEELKKCDPITAAELHPNNVIRVIRALEIFELTGKPLSDQRQFNHDEYKALDPSIVYVGLNAPRNMIYERINQRCEIMLSQGLIEETFHLLEEGYSPTLKPLQSIGYRHAIWFIKGLVIKREMLRLLQRDTRHFAKRQLTWFRRDPRINWYNIESGIASICESVVQACRVCQSRVE